MATAFDVLNASQTQLARLNQELQYAWQQTESDDLTGRAVESGQMLLTVTARRVKGIWSLVQFASTATYDEGVNTVGAARKGRFIAHVSERFESSRDAVENRAKEAVNAARAMGAALTSNPSQAGPQLLMSVLVSLLVSGGPDGNGGAPDSDIALWGIGAHRSPFTHSILMGASLETVLFSALALVRVLHQHLPRRRDPIWDVLMEQSTALTEAAARGASIGMAYHLLVDGLVQPAPYHGLPFSMPLEGHQAVLTANAVAEARDIGFKRNRVRKDVAGAIHAAAEGAIEANAPLLRFIDNAGVAKGDVSLTERVAERSPFEVDQDAVRRLLLTDKQLHRLKSQGHLFQALEEGCMAPCNAVANPPRATTYSCVQSRTCPPCL